MNLSFVPKLTFNTENVVSSINVSPNNVSLINDIGFMMPLISLRYLGRSINETNFDETVLR
jgi:hypothetical protein